jgi:methylamine---glutamate N-methyltransferase subunit B
MPTVDLDVTSLRDFNQMLHDLDEGANDTDFHVVNPRGRHAIAAGVDAPVTVEVDGNVGYYCAGMNKRANIIVNGSAGVGLAENMMSGRIHVKGDASSSAGATGCGGLLVIDGNASGRCGISARGIDIVVKGDVGHMSGFMAQAGNLVVLGNAGDALGDSIYEARIFVRGKVKSLGADCVQKPLSDEHKKALRKLLDEAGVGGEVDVSEFSRYGSARKLYHFHMDNLEAY